VLIVRPTCKWIATRRAEGRNQVANHGASLMDGFDDSLQAIMVELIPLWRNALGATPQVDGLSLFRLGKHWFKRLLAGYVLVDTTTRIDPRRAASGKSQCPAFSE